MNTITTPDIFEYNIRVDNITHYAAANRENHPGAVSDINVSTVRQLLPNKPSLNSLLLPEHAVLLTAFEKPLCLVAARLIVATDGTVEYTEASCREDSQSLTYRKALTGPEITQSKVAWNMLEIMEDELLRLGVVGYDETLESIRLVPTYSTQQNRMYAAEVLQWAFEQRNLADIERLSMGQYK